MKEYFKRLKSHPGLRIVGLSSVMMPMAAAYNKSIDNFWDGAIVSAIGIAIMWGTILISNIKRS